MSLNLFQTAKEEGYYGSLWLEAYEIFYKLIVVGNDNDTLFFSSYTPIFMFGYWSEEI